MIGLELETEIETKNIEQLQENCLLSLNQLFKIYENDNYMLQRIHTHVNNYLPNTLKNEKVNHEKRITRTHYLSNEQQIFIQIFLSNNKYFYLANNGYYYEYDGKNYTIVKESIIGSYSKLYDVVLDDSLIGSDTGIKGETRSLNIGDNTDIDLG